MFKKKQIKCILCMFITFLMVFTTVDTGILGMKQVYAETIKEENVLVKDTQEANEKTKKNDSELLDKTDIKKDKKEDKNNDEIKGKEEIIKKEVEVKKQKKDYKALVEDAVDKASDWMIKNFRGADHWHSIAIARAGKEVPKRYMELMNEGKTLPDDSQGQYSKFILGILAAGGDPTNVGGHNLYKEMIEKIKYNNVNQFGAPWDLAALNAINYKLPNEHKTLRDDLKKSITGMLKNGNTPDLRGFFAIALHPYYNNDSEVKKAMDDSVDKLSEVQKEDGGFNDGWSKDTNINSAAQALMAITLTGQDPTSKKFTKTEGNVVDYILSLQNEDGSFNWMKDNAGTKGMVTEQVVYALDQYLYYLEDKGSIWNFNKEDDTNEKEDNKDTEKPAINVKEQIDKNLAYILKNVDNPTLGTGAGEWSILCLARGNYPVPKGYYDKYHKNVVKEVQNAKGNLHKVKYTEHSRLILGLTSIGKSVTDVGGYNQLEKLADYNTVIRQGINGPIFALIALDTHNYEIPIVDNVKVQTTRDMLVQYILDKEIKKGKENAGGWALYGETPDPDITAMAIQGLTPYYKGNPEVKAAVDRAISWLSSAQKDDGGYSSWGSINSESIAQVVVALTGLGINPHTDSRFIKKGNSAIDALLTFADPKGGFMHVKLGGNTNGGAAAGIIDGMATDQGTYALIAYDRFINNKNSLYDMNDVSIKLEKPKEPQESEKFVATRVGEENLKKNSSAQVKFNVENILKEDEEVALAIVLYDKNTNEMINYSYVKKILKSGKKEVFAAGFIIPEKGDYLVKAIICDDLNPKKMNVLVDPIKIEVE